MTIIEQIKAEIERRIEEYENQCLVQGHIKMAALQDILSFLSTLEKSEKTIDGLDEEIERYLHSLGVGYGGWVDGMDDDDLRAIARHFAKWGAEHLASADKTSPNDLVKAAEAEEDRVIEEVEKDDRGCPYISSTHVYNAFVRGAKWNREQMMKESVEGVVVGDGFHCWIDANIPMSWMYQDKVRIIIVKED